MSKIVKSMHTTMSQHSRTLTIPVIRIISSPPASEPAVPVCSELELTDDSDTEQVAQALIAKAMQHAEELVAAARMEAEQIVSEAKTVAEQERTQADAQVSQIFEDAKLSGYQAGYEEGKTACELNFQQTIEQALQVLQSIKDEKKQYYLQAEQELVQLACCIAGQIMNREVQAEGSWVVATVQQALGEMIDPAKVEIYAHPQEIPLLTSHRHELQAQLNASSELQFVPDSNIEKGGCIVRTKHGAVDARIDTQVNEVKRALLDLAVNL